MDLTTNSPADVIRNLLADLNLGDLPSEEPSGAWPIRSQNEVDRPDNAITVINDDPDIQGVIQITGETQQLHGIQVRVRSGQGPTAGQNKINAIAAALDGVLRNSVAIGADTYEVYGVHRTSGPISLGKDILSASLRYLFTLNANVALRQTN